MAKWSRWTGRSEDCEYSWLGLFLRAFEARSLISMSCNLIVRAWIEIKPMTAVASLADKARVARGSVQLVEVDPIGSLTLR